MRLDAARGLWLLILLLTAARLWAAAAIPLTEDEAYYRLWSQHLHLGYYSASVGQKRPDADVIVATIGSVPVAISLKGAQSVHFADLDFSPAAVLQAEERPYEVGTNGLTIVYYVVEKSVDEHVVEMVISKMRTLETVVNEQTATNFREAFSGQSAEELAEEVWQRMVAAA